MTTKKISKQAAKPMTLGDLLTSKTEAIATICDEHLDAERLVKVALAACSRDKKLMECDYLSVLKAVMASAELGLECGGGVAGLAYLVPYGKTCQLIVGYKGLITLAMRTGAVNLIEAVAVFKGEEFSITRGTIPGIHHVPDLDRVRLVEDLRGCYMVARMHTGEMYFEWMNAEEIIAVKNRSAAQGGPWSGSDSDKIEMARKSVVRKGSKYLPITGKFTRALDLDADTPDFESEGRENVRVVTSPPTGMFDLNGGGDEQPPAETFDPDKADGAPNDTTDDPNDPKQDPPPNEDAIPAADTTAEPTLTAKQQESVDKRMSNMCLHIVGVNKSWTFKQAEDLVVGWLGNEGVTRDELHVSKTWAEIKMKFAKCDWKD